MRRDFPTSTEQILEQITALAEQVRNLTAKVDRLFNACEDAAGHGYVFGLGDAAPTAFLPEVADALGIGATMRVRVDVGDIVSRWDPTKDLALGAGVAQNGHLFEMTAEDIKTTNELQRRLDEIRTKHVHFPGGIVCSDCKPDTTS